MTNTRKFTGLLAFLLMFFVTFWLGLANATGGGNQGPPGPQGEQGPPGEDGRNGRNGKDGRDGADGEPGPQGIQGIQGERGLQGVIPTEWITETRTRFGTMRDMAAASLAMQEHLPQDRNSRLTFSGSHLDGRTGVGAGYAYMLDNDHNTALTFTVGHAGSETAYRASVGFEFGESKAKFSDYDKRLDDMQRQLDDSQRQAMEYKKKHSDVENLLVISQEHSEVCDESLTRCEQKVVGYK